MSSRVPGPELIQLKNAVMRHFTPANWKELGALTDTLDEVTNHPRLLRSLKWDDPDYDEHALTFLRKMIGERHEKADVVRNYITRNCDDVGENVSSVNEEGRKIVFNPQIFEIPGKDIDQKLVSVMMPFEASLEPVYDSIKEAASGVGLNCQRADDIWEHSTVIQDIFALIYRSQIVVCDFSDKNPNVFYEAGIAHTLGKHVVPITQFPQDIPLDLSHHRYLKYLNNSEGREQLKQGLISRFRILSGAADEWWL
jgi:hypothetical protein